MKTYNQVISYLNSFINYEKQIQFNYTKSLDLGRVKKYFAKLSVPYKQLNVIHLAGTKGKGSCSIFLASILAASDFKVGLYTSPHFFDLRERMQIVTKYPRGNTRGRQLSASKVGEISSKYSFDGQVRSKLISKKDLIRLIQQFKTKIEKINFDKKLKQLTFFEVLTAIAFKYFKEKKIDYLVLETGLGGRLDATNIVNPIVSVITHIDYDHTHILGNTLKKITQEKCGIIKKDIPVITSNQKREVLDVIKIKAKKKKAKVMTLTKDFNFRNLSFGKKDMIFDFKMGELSIKNVKTKLLGKHQAENASLALATLKYLKNIGLIEKKLNYKKGIKEAKISGRFEILKNKPLVIVDVAHNPSSFKALNEIIVKLFPRRKVILIFGACFDKNISGMLGNIKYDKIILTSFEGKRAYLANDLKEKYLIKKSIISKNIRDALKMAYKYYTNKHLIVISGSFFLVAGAKKVLK